MRRDGAPGLRRVVMSEADFQQEVKKHMDRGKTLKQAEQAVYRDMARFAQDR